MSKTRPELSKKNPYYITKYRFYELKYFCLQYPEWLEAVRSKNLYSYTLSYGSRVQNRTTEHISSLAEELMYINRKIEAVEQAAIATDSELYFWLLKSVTKGVSYQYLEIPCCRDTYYDRYRKFFWILDKILSSQDIHGI